MTDSYEVNDNNAAQALDYNQHSARWQYSVQNGCAVSINSGTLGQSDTLSVASGDIFFNGSSVTVSSQNVQIDSSNTDPRKDVVYLDTNGSAQVSKGTAEPKQPSGATKFDAYRPAPKDLTGTDTTIIAEVFVPGGASSIASGDLRDRRQFADVATSSLSGASVNYVQSSSPSNPNSSETWFDTGPGIFRVYADLGSGLDWHPIPPVQVLEEASTFGESDVTVTHTDTEVLNGSIQLLQQVLIDDFEDGNTTTKSADWDGWTVSSGTLTAQTTTVIDGTTTGKFESSNTVNAGVSSTRSSDVSTPFRIKWRIGQDTGDTSENTQLTFFTSSGTVLGNLRFNDGNENVQWIASTTSEVMAGWTADTTYDIEMVWDFANDNVDIIIDGTNEGTFSLQNAASGCGDIQILNDTGSSGATRSVFFDTVAEQTASMSGDALVEWDTGVPADINSWDLATFQETLDGETVTIDVEDGNGNVLFSDIGQNFDISTVDTSKEVKLRAKLSRSSTSNNPTCDYLARRFTR